uniref:Uncharacterized protein n=1 Tax=Arundo donax TaxID=35708 RepID=A0A0A9D815_ARUDO
MHMSYFSHPLTVEGYIARHSQRYLDYSSTNPAKDETLIKLIQCPAGAHGPTNYQIACS